MFLSAKVIGEIATMHKWEQDAAEYIRRTAAADAAKAKQKGAYDLRALCRARGMVPSASVKKPALVAWLEACTVRQRGLRASVAFGLSCSLGAPWKLRLDIATNVCSFLTNDPAQWLRQGARGPRGAGPGPFCTAKHAADGHL